MRRIDGESETLIPVTLRGHSDYGDGLPCLRADGGDCAGGSEVLVVAHSLTGEGFDASEDGTGRGTPIVACLDASYAKLQGCSGQDLNHGHSHLIAFDTTQVTSKINRSNPQPGDPCHPLTAEGQPPCVAFQSKASSSQSLNPSEISPTLDVGKCDGLAVGFYANDSGNDAGDNVSPTLRSMEEGGGNYPAVALSVSGTLAASGAGSARPAGNANEADMIIPSAMAVRRLTPVECARLQGFPDSWCAITYRGKPAADGPQYKAYGNSMAVPVIRHILRKIQLVEQLQAELKANR